MLITYAPVLITTFVVLLASSTVRCSSSDEDHASFSSDDGDYSHLHAGGSRGTVGHFAGKCLGGICAMTKTTTIYGPIRMAHVVQDTMHSGGTAFSASMKANKDNFAKALREEPAFKKNLKTKISERRQRNRDLKALKNASKTKSVGTSTTNSPASTPPHHRSGKGKYDHESPSSRLLHTSHSGSSLDHTTTPTTSPHHDDSGATTHSRSASSRSSTDDESDAVIRQRPKLSRSGTVHPGAAAATVVRHSQSSTPNTSVHSTSSSSHSSQKQ